MSTASLQQRDIRSASVPFKRDREHQQKWSNGIRLAPGVAPIHSELIDGVSPSQSWKDPTKAEFMQRAKVRPNAMKSILGNKTHANRTSKPTFHGSGAFHSGTIQGRLDRKADAYRESTATSPLSESLIAILPQHVNNTSPSIRTLDADILYSFDNKGPSPTGRGTKVELGSLIEQAEQKWIAEQTEKIIRGEYEVLDAQGEKTVLKKKRGSPKQKATKDSVKVMDEDDDDGFELI
ncbi:hypothetical protein HYALB_00003566 [Hymenoscyphus albidus]|uniref:Uncharacterized protein n=1 Tax=Hymenoscyphus albidus TaxID=595503 RepID=A0A9N9M2N9_9HELO|nr:hypothetical protein HYALB_00003566 [Hymenoscyphus albidus]